MTAEISAVRDDDRSSKHASAERVRGTVALLQRRGYALPPARLAAVCLAGELTEIEVRRVVAFDPELAIAGGLVVFKSQAVHAAAIGMRAAGHRFASAQYLPVTLRFVRNLVAAAPFIRSVAIGGSLASGGFVASDDVDLNLIVDDGHRHLAYVAVNVLGLLHALRHRGKPIDDLTRRPLAPRLMTANLILERSECHPLVRQDEDMAFEMMASEPVHGFDVFQELVDANPRLLLHFPQLARKRAPLALIPPARAKAPWLRLGVFEGLAEQIGRAGWRYMQWTRRHRPEALARVAFVRRTMRPYTLFDDGTPCL